MLKTLIKHCFKLFMFFYCFEGIRYSNFKASALKFSKIESFELSNLQNNLQNFQELKFYNY